MIDSRVDTYRHIQTVQQILGKAIADLQQRSLVHDQSKLVSPEVEIFDEMTPKLAASTYGSEEYKSFLSQMKPALDHHYAANDHHPEHFHGSTCVQCLSPEQQPCTCGGSRNDLSGVRGMSLPALLEMLCDWLAATKRHNNGDIRKSIEINQKRFGYSDELKQILLNTLEVIE